MPTIDWIVWIALLTFLIRITIKNWKKGKPVLTLWVNVLFVPVTIVLFTDKYGLWKTFLLFAVYLAVEHWASPFDKVDNWEKRMRRLS